MSLLVCLTHSLHQLRVGSEQIRLCIMYITGMCTESHHGNLGMGLRVTMETSHYALELSRVTKSGLGWAAHSAVIQMASQPGLS